jgi:hypothetical protein
MKVKLDIIIDYDGGDFDDIRENLYRAAESTCTTSVCSQAVQTASSSPAHTRSHCWRPDED